jgi:hypothetical protein
MAADVIAGLFGRKIGQLNRVLAPVTALIVGVHFFPLVRLFHVLVYVLTGALLSVLAHHPTIGRCAQPVQRARFASLSAD